MQDNLMQAQMQPFVKLARANMDLLGWFSTSPEVTAQANATANQWFHQASDSAGKLMQSGAFAHMVQGLLKNYTEFFTELSQSSLAMLSQGQATLARQMQDSTDEVIDDAGALVRQAV